MSVLFAILLFSFLIFIHEFGHFTAAKAFGIRVNEFSVFMGPVIWKKQKGETLYTVRCVPIGGFCAMEGEDEDSTDPRAFPAAAWWKRMIVLIAGAAMNFIAGVVLLACFFAPDQQFILPEIAEIEPGCSLAEEQVIQVGDRIWSLDGERVYVYSDFTLINTLRERDSHELVILRNGEKIAYSNVSMEKRDFTDPSGVTSKRYGFSFRVVEATFAETCKYTWNTAVDTVRLVRLSLAMLINGQAGLKDISGPVGIVQQMSEVAEASGTAWYAFLNMLYFGGFIAINLAVMNLLPIPALDGGRVVGLLLTTAVESVTRKKIDPRYEGYIHGIGMFLLLALMAVILFKDIFTVMRG